MFKTAVHAIEKFVLIGEGDKIVAALSGGPDSTALLFFLRAVKKRYGAEVYAVHLNHMIRGAEAEMDASFVSELCEKTGTKLLLLKRDVPKLAFKHKISVEEAGRKARYEAYKLALEHFGANKIATGHNKNDSAETFLFNLARGAGARGLSGIAPISAENGGGGVLVIRPLIGCSREQIEKYCAESALPFSTDSTNAKPLYTRNKIRLELIPWLQKNLNPDAVNAIASAAARLREQNALLESLAEDAFLECAVERGKKTVSLNIEKLKGRNGALTPLIIRRALRMAAGNLNNIEAVHIEDILSLCEKGNGKRISLPNGLTAEICYGLLNISPKVRGFGGFSYALPLNAPVFISEKNVHITLSDRQLKLDNFKNLCTKMYKCDKILSDTLCRTRLPGDRIKLPGGTKKLGDYFTDMKIPRAQRERAALIAEGGEVLSILGVCDSESVKHGKYEYYIQFWEDVNGAR